MQLKTLFPTGRTSVALLWAAAFSLGSAALQAQDPFITTWKTDNPGTSGATSITIPTVGMGYNYDVDWDNDGIYDQLGITGNVTHDFGAPGTYTIRITGSFPRIYFNGQGDRRKILSINQWGDIAWSSMERAFSECFNLTSNATDAPDLSGVTSLASMFRGAAVFNSDLSTWNTANVTNMSLMFYFAIAFNGDLSTWNTANVTNMIDMFHGARVFNGDLSAWNTTNVTSMSRMFAYATAFNGDISTWNTANVTDMNRMFFYAYAFNGDLNSWNTGNVTNMSEMFYLAIAFNGDLSAWNTANVTNMINMFYRAIAFNRDLSSWNVANVTNMLNMFSEASAFNQNLGDWDLNANVSMSDMLNNSGMSVLNYDNTLIGWNANPATPNGRFVGVAGLEYCNDGQAARSNLINSKGWGFYGDVFDCTGLPVELNDFQVKLRAGAALLTWSTASERNNAGFDVEWSLDGLAWKKLGFVAGHGISQEPQAYRYVHPQPQPGRNYYRLRQLDFDGEFGYSDIRSLDLEEGRTGALSIFPNPAGSGELRVSLNNNLLPADGTLRLFSATGQLLRQEAMTGSTHILDVTGVPAGVYLLEVTDGREVWQGRVVLQ